MDRVEIPADQVVPIDDIAPGVRGLRIAFVNVFSVEQDDGSWTLIDAALPFTESTIRRWAEKNHQNPPNAILLTHGHFDHVSAAKALADDWNVPIYAHPLEFPYLTGQQEYPAPNIGAGGGLMTVLSPTYPRGPVDLGNRLVRTNEVASGALSFLTGWTVLHTPGHTPGHVSLFRDRDRTLVVGDAFCTTKPESFFDAAIAQPPELHGPPAYFTSNWDDARRSVEKLAQLRPSIVAPGHGKPLSGPNVAESLQKLASAFDAVAVPENKQRRSA